MIPDRATTCNKAELNETDAQIVAFQNVEVYNKGGIEPPRSRPICP